MVAATTQKLHWVPAPQRLQPMPAAEDAQMKRVALALVTNLANTRCALLVAVLKAYVFFGKARASKLPTSAGTTTPTQLRLWNGLWSQATLIATSLPMTRN
jgi:hypothetical protein